jgi:hypothetical protein
MSGIRRGLMLLAAIVAMSAGCASTAVAQVATTTVQDTVYSANGTPATGTVLVSDPDGELLHRNLSFE